MERTKNHMSVSREDVLNFLGSSGHLSIDKRIVLLYEPNVAVFLSNLIDFYKYLKAYGKLDGEWFFCSYEQLRNHINLSVHKMRSCKEILKNDKIIKTKLVGVPAKEFYFIDLLLLFRVLNSINSSSQKNQFLEIKKTNSLKLENLTTNIKNKEEIKLKDKPDGLSTSSYAPDLITPILFEKFWSIYPKKTDKGKARTSWNKLCTKNKGKDRPTWITIKKAVLTQIKTERWSNPEFIPVPTTWINQSRWEDDPAEMKSFKRESDQTRKPANGFRSESIVYREADREV